MNIINKFGQRNFAKLLFIIAFFLGLLSFVVKNHNLYGHGFFQILTDFKTWLGLLLLSGPNGFLAWSAIKSREYRFVSIVLSMMILAVNFILFFLDVQMVLFLITIFELLTSILFFVIVNKSSQARKAIRPLKTKVQKTKEDSNDN